MFHFVSIEVTHTHQDHRMCVVLSPPWFIEVTHHLQGRMYDVSSLPGSSR